MNENLQNTLNEILAALLKAAEQAGAVAQEQLPLLVQEYLRWAAYKHGMQIATGSVLLSLGIWSFVKLQRPRSRFEDLSGWIIASVFGIGCGGALLGMGVYFAVQLFIAPRVYLLERVSEMVK